MDFVSPKMLSPSRSKISNDCYQWAFSLVEILVTVAIIAVVAVLAIPIYQKTLQASYEAGCVQNLGKWGQVIMRYIADNNGIVPPTYYTDPATGKTVSWNDAILQPYLQAEGLPIYGQVYNNPVPYAKTIWFCPQEKVTATMPQAHMGYSMNLDFDWANNVKNNRYPLLIPYASLLYPSEYCMMSESSCATIGGNSVLYTTFSYRMVNGGSGFNDLTAHHSGYPNFLYGDMHVASFRGQLLGTGDLGSVDITTKRFYARLWCYNGVLPNGEKP